MLDYRHEQCSFFRAECEAWSEALSEITDKPGYERPARWRFCKYYISKTKHPNYTEFSLRVQQFNRHCLQPDWTHLGDWSGRKCVPLEGCQNWLLSYSSGMAGPIVTKFVVWLETKQRCIFHRWWVRCTCTSARRDAHQCCAGIRCVVRDQLAGRLYE